MAPAQIEEAKEVLRDASGQKFFNLPEYASAAEVVDDALELIGAAETVRRGTTVGAFEGAALLHGQSSAELLNRLLPGFDGYILQLA